MDFKVLIFFGILLIDSCISFGQGGYGGRQLTSSNQGTKETYQGGHEGHHGRYLGGYYDIDDYIAVDPPPQIVLLDDQAGHGGRKLTSRNQGTRETYQGGHGGHHGKYLGGYYDIDDYIAVDAPPQIVLLDDQGGHGGRQLTSSNQGTKETYQGGHGGHHGKYLGGYYDIDDYIAVDPPPQIVLLDDQAGHGGRQLTSSNQGTKETYQGGHGGHHGKYLGGYYDIDDYIAVDPPPQIVLLDDQAGHGGRQLTSSNQGTKETYQGGHGGHHGKYLGGYYDIDDYIAVDPPPQIVLLDGHGGRELGPYGGRGLVQGGHHVNNPVRGRAVDSGVVSKSFNSRQHDGTHSSDDWKTYENLKNNFYLGYM